MHNDKEAMQIEDVHEYISNLYIGRREALDEVVKLQRALELANLKIKQLEAAVAMKEAVEKANV